MFINATVEFPHLKDPIHQAATKHRRIFGRHIAELVDQLDVLTPEELTAQLLELMEGAIITAQVSQSKTAAQHAKRSAEILVRRALKEAQEQRSGEMQKSLS